MFRPTATTGSLAVALAGPLALGLCCATPQGATADVKTALIPPCLGGVRFGMSTRELEAARPHAEEIGEDWTQYYETGLECRVFERADYTFDRRYLFWGEEALSRVRLQKRFASYGDLRIERTSFLSSLASAWGGAPQRFVRTQGLRDRHHLPVLTWRTPGVQVEAVYTPSRDVGGFSFEESNDPAVRQTMLYFELQITTGRYWGIPFFFKPTAAGRLSGSEVLFGDFDEVAGGDPLPPGERAF